MDKDSRSYGGTYEGVVHEPAIPFQAMLLNHKQHCPSQGATVYSFAKNPRQAWNSSHLTERM
jgi:hypothetical protein